MAKPIRYLTEEELIQVEALAAYLNTDQIADYLGVVRTTFYEMRNRQPEINERYHAGKAKCIERVAKTLIKSADEGSVPAQTFYLKTQAGWKETTVNELVDKTPPEKKMTTEELAAELQNELDKVGKKLVDI